MRNTVKPTLRKLVGSGILWMACLCLPCIAEIGLEIPQTMLPQAKQADAYLAKKDYDAAANIYLGLIKTYPNSPYVWCFLGVTRFEQGRFKEAHEAFAKAVALCPDNDYVNFNLGYTYYQLNQNEDAIKYLQTAITLSPDYAMSHCVLGKAYQKAGKQKEADEEFHKFAVLSD